MNKKVKIFLILEFILFVFLFIYFWVSRNSANNLVNIIYFTFVLFFSENLSKMFCAKEDIEISIIIPILIPAMIVLDPFAVGVVAMIGSIHTASLRNFIWYKFLFNRSMLFMAAGLGGFVLQLTSGYFESSYLIIPVLLGSLTYFIVNNGLVYLVVRLNSNSPTSSLVLYYIQLFKSLVVSYFLGLVFYYCYLNFGRVFIVLAIILIYILKDLMYSRIQQLNSFTQIVESFLKVIDSKDHYTEGHCKRVGEYCRVLCQALGFSRSRRERVVNMAKIHDIGKIYVKDKILKSSDKLTREEYEEMKTHSYHGYELLSDIDILKEDLEIILYHHERYDGTGYPEGRVGSKIPLGARILCICDAFDVMTTGRVYKPAMSKKQVIKEIEDCSGTQFDPFLSKKMVELITQGYFDDSFQDTGAEEKPLSQLSINPGKYRVDGMEG